jgi:SAM-dependent methyltransferase
VGIVILKAYRIASGKIEEAHLQFDNVYEDPRRAEAYAGLEFPGTYYLAFRDLPAIIGNHAKGARALDFGCGAGRSTRFLSKLGLKTIGVDIAENMIKKARELDPTGDYRAIEDDGIGLRGIGVFDLAFSAFTFDNIPTTERKITLFKSLADILGESGVIVNLVSSPEIYTHDWASFTTSVFPENRIAKNGDIVRTIMKDVDDQRPVDDILCDDDAYREIYWRAGLTVFETYRPLALESEPYDWVSETEVAPWVIYVLKKLSIR